jgi:hypothetical protein
VDVACVAAGLHIFTVVDDVHTAGDLTLHNLTDRAGQALAEGHVLALTSGEQLVQVIRPRQVSGVRDEDSIDTAPYAFSFWSASFPKPPFLEHIPTSPGGPTISRPKVRV